MQVLKFSQQCV